MGIKQNKTKQNTKMVVRVKKLWETSFLFFPSYWFWYTKTVNSQIFHSVLIQNMGIPNFFDNFSNSNFLKGKIQAWGFTNF